MANNPLNIVATGNPPLGAIKFDFSLNDGSVFTINRVVCVDTFNGGRQTDEDIVRLFNTLPTPGSGQCAQRPISLSTCLDPAYISQNQNQRTGRFGVVIGHKRMFTPAGTIVNYPIALFPGPANNVADLQLKLAYNPVKEGQPGIVYGGDPLQQEAQLLQTNRNFNQRSLRNANRPHAAIMYLDSQLNRYIRQIADGSQRGVVLTGPALKLWQSLPGANTHYLKVMLFIAKIRNMVLARSAGTNPNWILTTEANFVHPS